MIYQTDETRSCILAMAQRLFLENGLVATQMQDIARELKISRTSLYRYYQNKFELATEILSNLSRDMATNWDEVMEHTVPKANGLAEVEFYLYEFWISDRFKVAHEYMAEYDAFFSGERADETVLKGIARYYTNYSMELLTALIKRGINDASIRPDLDVHLSAVTLVNAVRSLQQRLIMRGRVLIEARSDEHPKMMTELLRYLVLGISARA